MSAAAEPLVTAVTNFSNGTATVSAINEAVQVVFSGTWTAGDNWTIILTDNTTGLQTQVGFGYVGAVKPTFTFTFNNKVYVLAGSAVYFSAVNEPAVWNDPNATGNGYVTLTNWYSTPEPIVSAAPFQGDLAFFARRTVQIWQTDANPDNWQILQIMENIGTLAPASVQPLGDFDVVFLYDSGIRSLRVRDITNNAFVNDMGSPIDSLVQASLLSGTALSNSTACSGVEPISGRYWLFLNGLIYVLSYYPTNKIEAWSTYTPVDSSGGEMNITQFVVYQGQIWAIGKDAGGNNAAWQYGGTNGNTYDSIELKVQVPFFDASAAGALKQLQAIDAALNAGLTNPDSATIYVSADFTSAQFDPTSLPQPPTNWQVVYNNALDTFSQAGNAIPVSLQGTHFSLYIQFNGDGGATGTGGPALLSLITLHYKVEDEKI